jgi:hypothetical protein
MSNSHAITKWRATEMAKLVRKVAAVKAVQKARKPEEKEKEPETEKAQSQAKESQTKSRRR